MSSDSQRKEVAAIAGPESKVTKRWEVPDKYRDLAIRRIVEVLENPDQGARNHMAAASILKSVVDTNIKVDEIEDRMRRLDAGKPTEISDVGSLGDAAQSLASQLEELTRPRRVIADDEQKVEGDIDLRIDGPEE